MKKVFSTSQEVIHVWASGRQEKARCRNVFFRSPERIYSYGHHFCLARRINDRVVALNRRSSSVTTAKHQREVRDATRHLEQLRVFDPDSPEDASRLVKIHRDNLLDLASRAKSRRLGYLLNAAEATRDHNRFCDLVPGFKRWKVPELQVEGWSSVAWAQQKAKEEEAAERKVEAERRKRRKELAEAVEKWRAGESVYIGSSLPTMLRLSKDGTEIETSRSARVPVADAVRVWPLILRARKNETSYRLSSPSVENHLGLYRLDEIHADGAIEVGCHHIGFDEVLGIAKQLGLEGA